MLGCFGYRAVNPGTTTNPRLPLGTSGYFVKYPGYFTKHPGTLTKYLKYRDGWVLPGYFKSLGLSFASKMGPDTGFLSWQSPRPLSVTHTETLITFLGLCVHKPELAIWVLDQVPGYFNEVPCLGVQLGEVEESLVQSFRQLDRRNTKPPLVVHTRNVKILLV